MEHGAITEEPVRPTGSTAEADLARPEPPLPAGPPCPGDSLVEAALKILNCADPWMKAEHTRLTVAMWRDGRIARVRPLEWRHLWAPDRPARDDEKVAEDECRHFAALAKRLEETGSHYGAFPVHDGLWESASGTAHSLPARLAVEHCVHEARGLDVLPGTIAKFARNGDEASAALLRDIVYPEEVSHCAAGVRWIRYLFEVAHGASQPAPPADAADDDAAAAAAAAAPSATAAPGRAGEPGAAAPSAAADDGAAAGVAPSPSAASGEDSGRPCGAASVGPAAASGAAASAAAASAAAASGAATSGAVASGAAAAAGEDEGLRARLEELGLGGVAGAAAAEGSVAARRAAAGGTAAAEGAAAGGPPSWVCDARRYGRVEDWFHSLVKTHFWGPLKASAGPPFNAEARAQAGFGPDWYLPLAGADWYLPARTAEAAAAEAAGPATGAAAGAAPTAPAAASAAASDPALALVGASPAAPGGPTPAATVEAAAS
ncbi:hypothetical protein TSOC_005738 [Tetrabaena socialis]|uniref:DUF455 domain-containing protein n=1 Tax=Tetrabaena socialis TaxID=47790 RepID=A0A2J8A5J5_9CHLO|nr:hypothetical protein TSOC_005738 [Tetrabaena socialis]|eukprot:PNH07763.1 hypothetical protein TSOC_005738 [Tetrabaena socialis]